LGDQLVRKILARGEITHLRIQGEERDTVRIDPDSLNEWIESHTYRAGTVPDRGENNAHAMQETPTGIPAQRRRRIPKSNVSALRRVRALRPQTKTKAQA